MGQKSVLLGFVETVDLVQKEQRPLLGRPPAQTGLLHDEADVLQRRVDRGEPVKMKMTLGGQQAG